MGDSEEEEERGDDAGDLRQQPIRRSRTRTQQSLLSDGSFGTCLQEEPNELSGWLEPKAKGKVKWSWSKPKWFELRSGDLTCWSEPDAADSVGNPRSRVEELTINIHDVAEAHATDKRVFEIVLVDTSPQPVLLRCPTGTSRDEWLDGLRKAKAAATPRISVANVDADFDNAEIPEFADDSELSRQASAPNGSRSDELASWTVSEPEPEPELTVALDHRVRTMSRKSEMSVASSAHTFYSCVTSVDVVEVVERGREEAELATNRPPKLVNSGQETPVDTAEVGDPPEDAPVRRSRKLTKVSFTGEPPATSATLAETAFAVGQRVEYLSETHGNQWVPGVVASIGDGVINLDIKPEATPAKVRAVSSLEVALELEPEPEPEPDPEPEYRFDVIPMAKRKYDFFLNHCQATASDQCSKLEILLKKAGYSVWFDMTAPDVTTAGMEEGVAQSRNVIIFLSKGIMSREFCHAEQRWALHYKCNLIGLVETDTRYHPAVIETEKQTAPADLKRLFDEVDFDVYQRKGHYVAAMVDKIVARRVHTVLKDGYLHKKGGDIEIEWTSSSKEGIDKGRQSACRAVKHRNYGKGGQRAWKERWFVLFDDGILQWYASGPPEQSGAFDRRSCSRRSLARQFSEASIEMLGEVDLSVAGDTCRWYLGRTVGLKSDTIVLETPQTVGGTRQSRSGIELRAVQEEDRRLEDPTGGWVEATEEFGAYVVGLADEDSDVDVQANPVTVEEQGATARMHTWSVERVAEWLSTTLELPEIAEMVVAQRVDGVTAATMEKGDWRELGASGVESAKIFGYLRS